MEVHSQPRSYGLEVSQQHVLAYTHMRYDVEKRDVVSWILNGIFVFLWLFLWKPISIVFSFLHRLTVDVAKSVYGKIVAILGATVFALLVTYFSGLFN